MKKIERLSAVLEGNSENGVFQEEFQRVKKAIEQNSKKPPFFNELSRQSMDDAVAIALSQLGSIPGVHGVAPNLGFWPEYLRVYAAQYWVNFEKNRTQP